MKVGGVGHEVLSIVLETKRGERGKWRECLNRTRRRSAKSRSVRGLKCDEETFKKSERTVKENDEHRTLE